MNGAQQIIDKYLDGRDGLSDEDWRLLIAAVEHSPDLALRLREHLIVDELLAQKLTFDRRNFLAQVDQRVRDYLQGEEKLYRQVAELRSYALKNLAASKGVTSWQTRIVWAAVAIAVVVAVGLGIAYRPSFSAPSTVAIVEVIDGAATLSRGGVSLRVTPGLRLKQEDRLETGHTRVLTIRYPDRSTIQVHPQSTVTLSTPASTRGKRLFLLFGDLTAHVTPQPAGELMSLGTPSAELRVVGTEFSLSFSNQVTQLDVTEGRVEIWRQNDPQPTIVQTEQSALASPQLFAVGPASPIRARPDLFCLFPLPDGAMMVRHKEQGRLKRVALEASGKSVVNGDGADFSMGGSLRAPLVIADVWSACRITKQLSLAIVFDPDSLHEQTNMAIVSAIHPDEPANFALVQAADRLLLRLRGLDRRSDGSQLQIELCHLPDDASHHVLICTDQEKLICYLDGREVSRSNVASLDFTKWKAQDLILGQHADGHSWQGQLSRLAMFSKSLNAEEAGQLAEKWNPSPERTH